MAWHDRISQVEMRRWEKEEEEEKKSSPHFWGNLTCSKWSSLSTHHQGVFTVPPNFSIPKESTKTRGAFKARSDTRGNHSSGVAMVVTKFLVRSGWPLGGSAFLRKSGINIFRNIFFYSQMRCIATVHTALSIFQRPPALLKESEYFDGGRMWCGRGKIKGRTTQLKNSSMKSHWSGSMKKPTFDQEKQQHKNSLTIQ